MELALTSLLAFASTNIDDLFLLALFFGDSRYQPKHIIIGQYLGIIVLVSLSLSGAMVGDFLDSRYVGLLGIFPIYLGIHQFAAVFGFGDKNPSTQAGSPLNMNSGIFSIATVTIANGGDNIGTYIPLFTTFSPIERVIMTLIFLALVFAWLKSAHYLARQPALARMIERYGHIITPLVLCLLGFYILRENGSFQLVDTVF